MEKINSQEMSSRFLKIASASLYDVLDLKGYPNQCISLDIKPLTPTNHLAGPAFTIRGHREPRYDDSLPRPQFDNHALFKAMYQGCIIVINAEVDQFCGHWGEMMSYSSKQFGAAGVVIDGGTRDREGLMAIPNWPVFARYSTPIESKKRWRPVELETPIYVTGTLTSQVRVNPGDWIVGDVDGVIVVPQEIAYNVLLLAEEVEEKEEGTRRELAEGVPIAEVYQKYKRM